MLWPQSNRARVAWSTACGLGEHGPVACVRRNGRETLKSLRVVFLLVQSHPPTRRSISCAPGALAAAMSGTENQWWQGTLLEDSSQQKPCRSVLADGRARTT